MGAANDLRELYMFLGQAVTQDSVSNFYAEQNIDWHFIPESAPHFGGLWEAAMKSCKHHLKRIVRNVQLTYEELTTVLTQIVWKF